MKYMTSFYEQVGKRIRFYRELLGLNQDEVGTPERGYIPNNLMWSIEKGEKYGENKSFITKKNLTKIVEGFKERIHQINSSNINSKVDIEITERKLILGDRLDIYNLVHDLYCYIAYNFQHLPKTYYKSEYYNNKQIFSIPSQYLQYILCFSATYAINKFFLNNHEAAYNHNLEYDFNENLLDNHHRMVNYFWIMRSNELINSFVNWTDQELLSNTFKKISDSFFDDWVSDEFLEVMYDLYKYYYKFEKYRLGYYCEEKLRTYSKEAVELYKYMNEKNFNETEKFRQSMFGETYSHRLDKVKEHFSHLFNLAENQDRQFLNIYLQKPIYSSYVDFQHNKN